MFVGVAVAMTVTGMACDAEILTVWSGGVVDVVTDFDATGAESGLVAVVRQRYSCGMGSSCSLPLLSICCVFGTVVVSLTDVLDRELKFGRRFVVTGLGDNEAGVRPAARYGLGRNGAMVGFRLAVTRCQMFGNLKDVKLRFIG